MEKKVNVTKATSEKEEKAAVQATLPLTEEKSTKETASKTKTEKETPVKEEPAKEAKTTEKKETAKKTTRKTTTKKKTTKSENTGDSEEVHVQFGGQEVLLKDVLERAKHAYIAEGHRASGIKSIRLYLKPEEGMAYYVINDKASGGITLF